MKSLIEAAIAILIVYLFFEWQKEKTATASAAATSATTSAPASSTAPSPCGCGGSSGGSQSNYSSPDAALPVSAPVGEHVLAGVFRTTQAIASANIPAPAPVNVSAGPTMRPRVLYSVSAA